MNKIFNLFACCILIKGYRRSLIVDTQRFDTYYIPNDLFDILNNNTEVLTSNNKDNIAQEYLDFLLDNELGFLFDRKDCFPDINLKWESPFPITNAILEIENFENYNLSNAINQLNEVRCENILIKLYGKLNLDDVKSVIGLIKNKLFKNVDILISHNAISLDEVIEFVRLTPIIRRFTLTNSKENKLIQSSEDGMSTINCIKTDGKTSKFLKNDPSFFNLNVRFISESVNFNNYLNKKISIDKLGYLKNIPSFKENFGHIDTTKILNVITTKEFTKFWNITKDNVEICKDCEHRYICPQFITTSDRVKLKPSICSYDPYTAKW